MKIIAFPLTAIITEDIGMQIKYLNWALDQGFEILYKNNLMVQQKPAIARPNQQPVVMQLTVIMCSTTEESFRETFSIEYNEENIKRLPDIIKDMVLGAPVGA